MFTSPRRKLNEDVVAFPATKAAGAATISSSEIYVAPGTYKENLILERGVEIYGTDAGEVIIEAEDDDDPVVKMYHKSEIHDVTLKGGEHGVKVRDKARVAIVDCIITINQPYTHTNTLSHSAGNNYTDP